MKITFFLLSLLLTNLASGQTVGQNVVDRFDRIGVVDRIENGKIFYKTSNGFMYDGNSSDVVPEVASPRFPIHGKIIDNFERQGLTELAFADGRVSFRTTNGFQYISKNISPEVTSRGLLRPGIQAMDNFERIGQVEAVYDNGKVAYRTSNGFEYINSNISPAVSELRGIKVNDRVIDSFDRIGMTENLFQNGKVSYRTTNGFQYVNSNVSREVSELPNGIKPGKIVIDQFERIGSTEHAFEDGRVNYRTTNGFEYTNGTVSPEVDNHPKYQKNVVYASNSDIGEVVRFFSNGKIEVKGDNTSFCETLYEEVESVDGIAADSEVISPAGEGKVDSIFSNRMAKIKLADGILNAKILKTADIENRLTRDMWLQAIFYKLTERDVVFNIHSAVEKKDYEKILDLIKVDLNDPRNIRYNRDAKVKLNTYLDNELRRIQQI